MYCTVDDIINASKSFSFFSQHKLPDRGVLANIGEMVSNELNGYLTLYGYNLPVQEDSALYKFLSSLNVLGVLAMLMEKMIPLDARASRNVAQDRFNEGINLLKNRHYIGYKQKPIYEENNKQW